MATATTGTKILQANRLLTLDTPLGEDKLKLTRLFGSEGISQLFRFELEMFSEDDSIRAEDIIGKGVTVAIVLADGSKRFINGIMSRFVHQGETERVTSYAATLVPRLWLLTRRTDSRIVAQDKDVKAIIEDVFLKAKFSDFEFKLKGDHGPRELCVQYNETDFDFVSRLMEEEGIYYFFRHEEGKHTMVISDVPETHEECPKQGSVRFRTVAGVLEKEDALTSFSLAKEIRSGSYAVNDYDFKKPSSRLLNTVKSSVSYHTPAFRPDELSLYEYPANFIDSRHGDQRAKVRMEAEEARFATAYGTGDCRAFASGCRFRLEEGPLAGDYVITTLSHEVAESTYFSSDALEGDAEYRNSFTCIPQKTPFRPERRTPRPVIAGAQTAVVWGGEKEEIVADEHGRVMVRFHWQRDNSEWQRDKRDPDSCWIRVGQVWAGKGFGAMFIPRVGDEVIVEFLEGNPDRPMVTGCVYNGERMPPYKLPDELTRSTIKTNTSPGGQGFNEIRFEDAKDKEQVFIHGQRNLDIQVKNDMFETVGSNSNIVVKKDRAVTVEQNLDEKIKGKLTETVEKDAEITIKGNEVRKVGGTFSIICEKGFTEDYKEDCSIKSERKITLHGQDVVIEAVNNITLKVGSSTIVLDKGGISVKTSGSVEIKGGAQASMSGPLVSVKGDAQATLESGGQTVVKGAMVMIN